MTASQRMAQAISVTFLLLCFKFRFIAGCDNVLSSDSGWFTSPNHPGNYPIEANYCWLIKSTQPIDVSFTKFELENNKDWLTIYNGPTPNSEILLQISQTPPLSVVSTTNQTLITFTSDGIGSYSGFNITYKPSTCNYVLSSDSGEFTSPGYPSKYPENTNCRWLINATQPIALYFKTIYLQQNVFVTIYDGPTESFPVILKSSEFEPWAVVSTANQLLVTFISDSPKSFKGFNARYEPSPCQHISAPDSGWFSLANHPLNSPNNTQYCWLITATNPIMLSYSHLSPRRNKLRVYDGQTNGKRLYLPTKSNSAENFFISSSNQMFVVLITFGTSESFSGFNATYKQCIVQSSDSGRLTTPNHPEDCSNGASCCWVINTIAPLEFSFDPFHTAENNDELRIYNGPIQTSTLLLESQGNNFLWSSKKSTTTQILVIFTSNTSDSFSELNLTYSTTSCHNVYVTERLNRFTSPNYPENYPENSNECWLINSEHPIMISFSQFELEINYDWLRVYDGPFLSSPLLLEASSNYTIPSSIVSSAHQVLVTFNSDNKNSYSGFSAIYSSYYPGITERPIECNEFIHVNSSSGYVLTSLNFPSSYPNIRCNWNFESDPSTKIKFSFTDFSTQLEDYVSIFYWKPKTYIPSSFMLLSGINASKPLSCNYISKENFMHVYFNPFSDPSMNRSMSSAMGFRATVTATRINGCGGNFSDSAGVLLGYEADAQHVISSGCVWYIQVVPGSQVNLTLNTLLGPKSSPDSYYLKVYEGQDLETEHTLFGLTDLSSLSMPFSVVSRSNEIVVLLNDETEYDNDRCLPRDYTKLSLSYETITSST